MKITKSQINSLLYAEFSLQEIKNNTIQPEAQKRLQQHIYQIRRLRVNLICVMHQPTLALSLLCTTGIPDAEIDKGLEVIAPLQ